MMAKLIRTPRRSVTMRDVAELAAVSQSTVSRVLSNAGAGGIPISEETAHRIHEAVRQLGYHPNLAARSLRGQTTSLIAMMVADIGNPYYHHMARSVQDVARKHNYDVLLANCDHDPQLEHHFIEGIIRRPVDGVILTPYHLTSEDIDHMVQRTGVQVVVLGQHLENEFVDTVFADDGTASYEAMQWLIHERGHRRIAYIDVPGTRPGDRRRSAYRRALIDAGINTPAEYVHAGDFGIESGERAMRALMALPERPTAVFACNDLMALGCLMAANDLGLSVPGDVAIIGFDNIPEAARVYPPLTTIAQFPKDMGAQLANALFERIEGTISGPGRSFEIPCRLIVRDSA
ncbi:MAG: LacI family DNA-binding transcriptional regulator [Chloroflexi bacterium]|nr:LacI family DNA-binding transcriptional regulator [Chloroflexota bacterium]